MKTKGAWIWAVILSSAVTVLGCSKDETPASSAATPVETTKAQPTATVAAGTHTRATKATKVVNVDAKGTSTKPAAAIPKPDKKVDNRITSNKDKSADTGEKCEANEEGMATCLGTYTIFCAGGQVWALDCSLFMDEDLEEATCGEIEGEIACGWED